MFTRSNYLRGRVAVASVLVSISTIVTAAHGAVSPVSAFRAARAVCAAQAGEDAVITLTRNVRQLRISGPTPKLIVNGRWILYPEKFPRGRKPSLPLGPLHPDEFLTQDVPLGEEGFDFASPSRLFTADGRTNALTNATQVGVVTLKQNGRINGSTLSRFAALDFRSEIPRRAWDSIPADDLAALLKGRKSASGQRFTARAVDQMVVPLEEFRGSSGRMWVARWQDPTPIQGEPVGTALYVAVQQGTSRNMLLMQIEIAK